MPQELRGRYSIIGGRMPLRRYPQLVTKIVMIIDRWNHLENKLAMLLALLLRADHDATLAMYHSAPSFRQRCSMLEEVGQVVLTKALSAELSKVLKCARQRAEERNRLVHCTWGLSDKHQNALVLNRYGGIFDPKRKKYGPMVYTAQDFDDILGRLDEFDDYLHGFMLRAKLPDHGAPISIG